MYRVQQQPKVFVGKSAGHTRDERAKKKRTAQIDTKKNAVGGGMGKKSGERLINAI